MKLTIYHTNDIHSNYDRLAGIAAYLKAHRQPEDFYFDCGDLCDLKNLMVQGTKGLGAVRLLQAMNADAIVVGNNEIDLEHDNLTACASVGLPLLSCNLTDNDGNPVEAVIPSMVVERRGLRILLIGASPYYGEDGRPGAYNVFYAMGNLITSDPYPAIEKELKKWNGAYDFCILLSHGGMDTELDLLNRFPEINLCIGGHSHSLCSRDQYNQAGRWGTHLGKITLTIENQKVTRIEPALIENRFDPDPEILRCLQEQTAVADKFLSRTLYEVEELSWSVTEENQLTNFIADALFTEYPCDLAFINSGIVEGSIAGSISRKKLLALSPSKLNPTRFPLSGAVLREAIRCSMDADFVRQDGHGPGVRGSVLGTLGFSHNVRILRSPLTVWVDGAPLQDDQIYDCMADDSLQRGTGYTMLKTPDEKSQFYEFYNKCWGQAMSLAPKS